MKKMDNNLLPLLFNISFPLLAFPHMYMGPIPMVCGRFPKIMCNSEPHIFLVDFHLPRSPQFISFLVLFKCSRLKKIPKEMQVTSGFVLLCLPSNCVFYYS